MCDSVCVHVCVHVLTLSPHFNHKDVIRYANFSLYLSEFKISYRG